MQDSYKVWNEECGTNNKRKITASRLFLVFVVLPLFFVLLHSAFAQDPSPFDGDKLLNHKAPEFALKNLNGSTFSLSSYKGRVVLLNFWATWCPPCRAEIPSLNKLSAHFKDSRFSIIAVATDRSVQDVKEALKSESVDFTVLVDNNISVSRPLYKVFMLPTSFLIDKKGVIVERYYGEVDWTDPQLIKKVESLL